MWRDGTLTNQYGISAIGERTTKAGTGYTGTQRFVYSEDGGVASGQKLLGEYDNTGAAIVEHVYLNDTPIAVLKGTGAYLVQADHLNTPRAILGAANALVWKWDSDAFGTTTANENPGGAGTFNYNLRFPGQYYDKESGGHYNYFRDLYFSKTGRYLQSDPIGLKGGINTYGYVGGNPVGFSDPYGLFDVTDLPTIPQPVVDAVAGFGDGASLGITNAIRDALDTNSAVDKSSGSYTEGAIGGAACTGAAGALRGAAAFGGTRLGNSLLNSNRYLRIGPGRMPANGSLPASPSAPRISIGKGPSNPHIDLRVRDID